MFFEKNLAYDLSLFETGAHKNQNPIPSTKNILNFPVKRNKKTYLKISRLLSILLASFIVLLFSVKIINGQIELSELTQQVYNINRSLEEDKNTETQLKIKLECKLSLSDIEHYSKKNLKMQKPENDQIEYIRVSEDK
ncbi:MAG: hypothetical protein LBI55_03595 [Oscillospiraceae bacterium]|jgi:hypothetical protein|nr:hypothetical protein [Oscillospiraceae bacterium]